MQTPTSLPGSADMMQPPDTMAPPDMMPPPDVMTPGNMPPPPPGMMRPPGVMMQRPAMTPSSMMPPSGMVQHPGMIQPAGKMPPRPGMPKQAAVLSPAPSTDLAEKQALLESTISEAPLQHEMGDCSLTFEDLKFKVNICSSLQAESTMLKIGEQTHTSDGLWELTQGSKEFGGKDGLRYVYHRRVCCAELRASNLLVSVYDSSGNLQGVLADRDKRDYVCCNPSEVAVKKVLNGKGEQIFALRRRATCQDMCHCFGYSLPCCALFSCFPPMVCCRPDLPNFNFIDLCADWWSCLCPAICPFDSCLRPCLNCCAINDLCKCRKPDCTPCAACIFVWPLLCVSCDCTSPRCSETCPEPCCHTIEEDLEGGNWQTPVHEAKGVKATVTGKYKRFYPLNMCCCFGMERVNHVNVKFQDGVSEEEKIAFSTVMMWEAGSLYPHSVLRGQSRTAAAVEEIAKGTAPKKQQGKGNVGKRHDAYGALDSGSVKKSD